LGSLGAAKDLYLIEIDDFFDYGLTRRLYYIFDIARTNRNVVPFWCGGEVEGARPKEVG
jgi:hypothetical protein